MYYDIKNECKITLQKIRENNPNISLPTKPNKESLELLGYCEIVYVYPDTECTEYQTSIESDVEYSNNQAIIRVSYVDMDDKVVIELKKIQAQKYLEDTDYINHKYKEEVELFPIYTKEEFLSKYADIYSKRSESRNLL